MQTCSSVHHIFLMRLMDNMTFDIFNKNFAFILSIHIYSFNWHDSLNLSITSDTSGSSCSTQVKILQLYSIIISSVPC